jgi:hypothetical protein
MMRNEKKKRYFDINRGGRYAWQKVVDGHPDSPKEECDFMRFWSYEKENRNERNGLRIVRYFFRASKSCEKLCTGATPTLTLTASAKEQPAMTLHVCQGMSTQKRKRETETESIRKRERERAYGRVWRENIFCRKEDGNSPFF